MKPFIILIGIIIFGLTFSTLTFSGTLYKWTDENGVMHISTQPPPEDIEHKKSKFENSPAKNQNKAEKLKFKPIYDPNKDEYSKRKEEMRQKAEREKAERAEKREQEAEARKGKRELKAAKRRYEYLESKKETYRAYYHDATTSHYRNYWYNKMKEADDARSEYFRLKNKYGE